MTICKAGYKEKMTFQLADNGPEIYEKVLVPLWFGRWADALMDLISLKPGENVLDIACGTGVTTRKAKALVGQTGQVDGLDINQSMLAQAAEIADGMDIDWIRSDVTDIALPSGHYDVVLSQHGYHYFPEKPAALGEFHRLLKEGGRLAFSIWDGHSAYTEALCAAVERHISPDIAAKQRAQRQTPSADTLETHLRNAGFPSVEVHRQALMMDVPRPEVFVPLHLASMPIAAAFQALDETVKLALIGDVAEALDAYIRDDRMLYPDAVHVAVGYR